MDIIIRAGYSTYSTFTSFNEEDVLYNKLNHGIENVIITIFHEVKIRKWLDNITNIIIDFLNMREKVHNLMKMLIVKYPLKFIPSMRRVLEKNKTIETNNYKIIILCIMNLISNEDNLCQLMRNNIDFNNDVGRIINICSGWN